MKFNIIYEMNLNSMQKALSVYRQLRRGQLTRKDICFNSKEKVYMTFDCKAYSDNDVLVNWKNNSILCDCQKIFQTFFVDVGYKGKIELSANFK